MICYWDAVKETDNSIAGTALMGLSRLAADDLEIDGEKVAQTALALARGTIMHQPSSIITHSPSTIPSSPPISELTRISALRVCADLELETVLPLARCLAEEADNIPLQIVAIAALGDVGGLQEELLLRSIIREVASPLLPAARSALDRLLTRNREPLRPFDRAQDRRSEGKPRTGNRQT